ncbi:MAG: response regulator [Candidatus Hydrothermarchaeales archaeon]
MVVDDEPGIRFILRKMLEGAGYKVLESESGEECLDILDKEKVDLVLMDVMMPGMNGWETTKRIRENEALKITKVIMLTVRADEEDMEKSFQYAGSNGHINKPIVMEQLLATVKWVLDNVRVEG